MSADAAGDRREVIVVGGGQAGLAIGYLLAQQGRQFTILEAADTPGIPTATRVATTSSPTSPTTRATSTCRSSSAAVSAPSVEASAAT
jgi:cation diffusion facilitator CzcD-associated flavoprotein CzcO